MAWQCTAILGFTLLITLVLGRPRSLERRKAINVLTASRMELNASFTHHENINSNGMKIPLYMMQLYKTLIMGNDTDSPLLEHPILFESDSVLSLTAKRKYCYFLFLYISMPYCTFICFLQNIYFVVVCHLLSHRALS